jgi:threonine dehydratase
MVIAGQGTLALELLQQDAHIDRVFVPSAAAVWRLG